MASLADTPDLVGFFSYSREDDEGSGGRLSKLRERIQEELRGQLGRTKRDFRLWQDKVSISHGELWEDNIKKAVSEAVFFIPIITPTAVKSRYCKFEFETFLAREKELDRSNLVFPILYIPVPALTGDGWREDPLLAIIGSRQYDQWQNLRHLDPSSTEVSLRVEKLCENISNALQQPWVSPQERQEAEARRVAEEARLLQEQHQEVIRRNRETMQGEVRKWGEDARLILEAGAKKATEAQRETHASVKRYYEEKVAAGDLDAIKYLGNNYYFTGDYAEAKRWYEKAAAAGDANSMYRLGQLYYWGCGGVLQDWAEAKRWYEKAAAGGCSEAMLELGDLYKDGWAVTRSVANARTWCERAAAAGDEDAQSEAQSRLADLPE